MKQKYNIIFEDNHLLVVNKPAGMLAQGDITGDETLIDLYKGYIKKKYNKPGNVYLGLVHRIDRPVSGLVILAKTSKALERMSKMFQENKVKKTYWALVKKNPPNDEDTLINWLVKDHNKNISRVHGSGKKGAKLSELFYKILGRIGDFYLLEVHPKSGRPHQIRVQLSNIGSPIVGDIKYGYKHKNKDGSIQLHAKMLEFEHPVKNTPIKLNCQAPSTQIWQLFKNY